MDKLAVRALQVVVAVVLAGTVLVEAAMVWTLVSGNDREGGTAALTALRVATIVGMLAVQLALACLWRLLAMVRARTVFSPAAFRYVDGLIGAIVASAAVWFAVTAVNAPGQRDDPGVTVIMTGIGVAIVGMALAVVVLRSLLAQAIERDVEAARLRAELDARA